MCLHRLRHGGRAPSDSTLRFSWIDRSRRTRSLLPALAAMVACLLSSMPARAQVVRQGFYATNGSVITAVLSGNTLYIGGWFTRVGPATGGGLPIDGSSGSPISGFPKVAGTVQAVVADGSGGWYIGGRFSALALGGTTAYVGGSFGSVGGQVQSGIAAMGDLSTPTLLSLVSSKASPGHVRLAWFASDRDLVATVYRRTVADGWNVLRQISADGTGQLGFDGTDVSPGMRYGYRLGVIERGRELFLSETWVDVPIDAEFALASPTPNPTAVDLTIAFSLPDASEAWLELLDIAGRRLIARESVGPGPGNHVVGLAKDRVLAPGIYLVRLTHGKLSRSTRVVVER